MHQRKRNRAGRFIIRLTVRTLATSIILLYILCLTGSTYTNPHVPAIFLAQIQQSNTSLLVGFYGICVNTSSPSPTCTTTINSSPDTIIATLFPAQATSPNITSLITFALDLQQKTFPSPFPVAAGLFLLGLFFISLTRLIHKRQRHLIPSRRLRYLKAFTLSLAWLSTSLALTAVVSAREIVNGLVYAVTALGNGSGAGGGGGDVNISAGGLLQVLLRVVFGAEVVFSVVTMGVLMDERRADFERVRNEFEDEHIIFI